MTTDDQMRRLAEAATPGPWGAGYEWVYRVPEEATPGFGKALRGIASRTTNPDAAFIAAAREKVPELLDRVAAAEAEVERLTKENRAGHVYAHEGGLSVRAAESWKQQLDNAASANAALGATVERVRALIDSPYARWIEEGLEGGPAMVSVTAVHAALDDRGDDAVGT